MDAVSLLRAQYQFAHDVLDRTVDGLTDEQAHRAPAGKGMPTAAAYAHVLAAEDAFLRSVLQIGAPLMASGWAGRTGVSEPPPMGPWGEWAARVRVDLPATRQYAQAVYAATDAYLAGLSPTNLDRPLDLSRMGQGQQTVAYFLMLLLFNIAWHTGEISSVKGGQGLNRALAKSDGVALAARRRHRRPTRGAGNGRPGQHMAHGRPLILARPRR